MHCIDLPPTSFIFLLCDQLGGGGGMAHFVPLCYTNACKSCINIYAQRTLYLHSPVVVWFLCSAHLQIEGAKRSSGGRVWVGVSLLSWLGEF